MFSVKFDNTVKINGVLLAGDLHKIKIRAEELQNAINELLTATVRANDHGHLREIDVVDSLDTQLQKITQSIAADLEQSTSNYRHISWPPQNYTSDDQKLGYGRDSNRRFGKFENARDRIKRTDEEFGR